MKRAWMRPVAVGNQKSGRRLLTQPNYGKQNENDERSRDRWNARNKKIRSQVDVESISQSEAVMATNRPEPKTFSATKGSTNDLPRFPEQKCTLCGCAAQQHTVDYTGQRLLCPTLAEQEAFQAQYLNAAELRTKELAARLEQTMKAANAGRMTISEAVKRSKPIFESEEAGLFRSKIFDGGSRAGKTSLYNRIVNAGKKTKADEAEAEEERRASKALLRRAAAIEKIARAVGVSAEEVVNKTGGIPVERLEEAIQRFELEEAQKAAERKRQEGLEAIQRASYRPQPAGVGMIAPGSVLKVPPGTIVMGNKRTVDAYKALAGADLEAAYFDEIGDYEIQQQPAAKKPQPAPAVTIGGKRRYFEE